MADATCDALALEGALKFGVPDGHAGLAVNHVGVRHGLDFDGVDAWVRDRGEAVGRSATTAARAQVPPYRRRPQSATGSARPTRGRNDRWNRRLPPPSPASLAARCSDPQWSRDMWTRTTPPDRPGANGHKPGQRRWRRGGPHRQIATTRCVVGARRSWTIHSPNGVRSVRAFGHGELWVSCGAAVRRSRPATPGTADVGCARRRRLAARIDALYDLAVAGRV